MTGHQQHRERPSADDPAAAGAPQRSTAPQAVSDAARSRNGVALVSALVAITAIAWAIGLLNQPGVAGWEPSLFACCGAALLAVTLAVLRSGLATAAAANLTTGAMWLLITERLLMIGLGDAYADPAVAIFLPVHGTLPVLSLLFIVLQPYPRAIRLASAAWLVQAAIVTATLWPFLGAAQPRAYLHGTLLFVWLLMAIHLALLAIWTRQQRALIDAQARLAATEHAARMAHATSELRFRTIFEQATAGIGLVSADRCWIDVNARMAELTGYPIAELRGMSLCQLLPPEDRDAGIERLAQFLSSDAAPAQITIERRWLRRDGSTVWVANHLRRIPADAGLPATALLMSIDISDRRQAEEAALHQQKELRAIFDQTTVGIAVLNAEGRWLNVNRRLCEMFGRSEAEMLATDFQSMTHPDDLARQMGQVDDVIAGRRTGYQMEKRYLRPDGEVVWGRLNVGVVEATVDAPARFVSVIEDISEHRRMEHEAAALRRVRELHVDHTPLAVIEWDPELRVRRWSKRAEALFGWSEAEVLGRTPFEWRFIHEDEITQTERVIDEIRSITDETVHTRNRHYHRDGRVMWCQWYTSALHAADGSIEAYYSLGDDITAEHETQQALIAAEARFRVLFDQVAAGIGRFDHETRWIEVNPTLAELHGTTTAAMLGKRLVDDAMPAEQVAVAARLKWLLDGEIDEYTVERPVVTADGSTRWLMAYLRRVEGPDAEHPQGVLMALDISARKAAEAAALEHQRVRDFHFHNTPLAVIEWTPDLRVQRWSPRATELYGWEEHEVIGRTVSEFPFIHDADLPRVSVEIESMLSASASVEISNRNYHKDGRTLWCQWHNSVLRDADGQVLSVFSLVKDVSDEQFTIAALKDSQARFKSIFEQSAVGIVMIDALGNWLMVNQRFREIVGYDAEELLQHNCEEITEAKDRAAEALLRDRLIAGEIDDYSFEKRYRRRDGKLVWVSLFARRLDEAGNGNGNGSGPVGEVRLSLVVVDITERRRAEAEVRKLNADLENRVALRTGQLNDTVRNWAQRNQELRIVGEMMALLPAARDLAESSRIVECYLPQIFSRCGGAVWLQDAAPERMELLGNWGCVQGSPLSLSRDDCWGVRRGQTIRIEDPADPLFCPHLHGIHVPLRQRPHACVPIVALGESVGMIHLEWNEHVDAGEAPPDPVLIRNVAEQVGLAIGNVRLREELRRQAIRDPLTGLYNRRHFDETLKNRIAEHGRNGRRFALLMIDIDHFKRINDEHGHDVGDEVLRETGGLLQRIVRSDEAVFRLGGEEFAMIVDDGQGGGSQATGCAERVRREVEAMRVTRRDRPLPAITVSIGLARYPQDVPPGVDSLQRADAALYIAKRTGRNRVCSAGAIAGHDGVAGSVK
ncbi:MAG: hypothetical protein C0434_15225 [Xanthomonadaceae bacterium]|nr:hypothetical protein [Xanthomonadaceae bacterium]